MQLSVKKSSIQKIFFIFFVLSDVAFMGMPGLSNIFQKVCTGERKFLSAGIGIVMVIFILIDRRFWQKTNEKKKKIFDGVMFFYMIMVLVTYFISQSVYHGVTFGLLYYAILLLYFANTYWLDKDETYFDFVVKSIIYIGTINSVYSIVVKLIYATTGKYILNQGAYSFFIRQGDLRLVWSANLIAFSAVLSLACLFSVKKSRYLIFFIIQATALFYTTLTRNLEISLAIVLLVFMLVYSKKKYVRYLIMLLGLMAIILMWNVIVQQFTYFFSTSSSNSDYANSSIVRLAEVIYYLSLTFHNGIVGVGFPPENYESLVRGPLGQYALSDIGFISVISVFGILGCIFLAILIAKLIHCIVVSARANNNIWKWTALGLMLVILISNVTLSFNDLYRISELPMYLPLIQYCMRKIINEDSKLVAMNE